MKRIYALVMVLGIVGAALCGCASGDAAANNAAAPAANTATTN